jgi:hypothetical protein
VLAQVNPQASLEVFERDCLIYLGVCVAPKGVGKPGRPCFRYSLAGPGGAGGSGEVLCGDLKLVPLPEGATATITVEPDRAFDAGEGPGKRVERTVRGGSVGIVLDGRGRPLELPTDRASGRPLVERWVSALDLYPGLDAAVGAHA